MKLNTARESVTASIFLNVFPHRVRHENLFYLILRRRGLGGYQGLPEIEDGRLPILK
jgi:hypothetical protein